MAKGKGTYLVAYDIREPRRLRRVHYRLKKAGMAVQYSVFLVDGHRKALEVHTLLKELTEPEDDVRIYQIQGRHALWMAGRDTQSRSKAQGKGKLPGLGLFSKLIAKLGA